MLFNVKELTDEIYTNEQKGEKIEAAGFSGLIEQLEIDNFLLNPEARKFDNIRKIVTFESDTTGLPVVFLIEIIK